MLDVSAYHSCCVIKPWFLFSKNAVAQLLAEKTKQVQEVSNKLLVKVKIHSETTLSPPAISIRIVEQIGVNFIFRTVNSTS